MLAFTYPPVGAAFVGSLPAAVRGPAGRSPARHLWRPTPKCVPSRRASPGGTWIVNIPRVQLWGSLCSLFRKSPSCLVSSHWVGTNPTVHFCDSHAVFLERCSASLPHSSYRTSVHISHTHALYIYIYIRLHYRSLWFIPSRPPVVPTQSLWARPTGRRGSSYLFLVLQTSFRTLRSSPVVLWFTYHITPLRFPTFAPHSSPLIQAVHFLLFSCSFFFFSCPFQILVKGHLRGLKRWYYGFLCFLLLWVGNDFAGVDQSWICMHFSSQN